MSAIDKIERSGLLQVIKDIEAQTGTAVIPSLPGTGLGDLRKAVSDAWPMLSDEQRAIIRQSAKQRADGSAPPRETTPTPPKLTASEEAYERILDRLV